MDGQPTPPLGTIDWPIEEPTVIALPDDWQLFFYTDGLIEGRLRPGSHERYGEERLVESLCRRWPASGSTERAWSASSQRSKPGAVSPSKTTSP